tara:strand:+ start:265 stop:1221 length:957 start_codon:yes stop_codon:yes gene_type:complete
MDNKKKFFTRAYNKIVYNKKKFSVIKTSKEKRLLNEIYYLENLPENKKIFFPQIINTKKNNKSHYSLELEFLPYNNLGLAMIGDKFNKKYWSDTALAINNIIKNFQKEEKRTNYRNDQIQMFIKKTETEYFNFKKSKKKFQEICNLDKIHFNNNIFDNFESIWPRIKKKIIKKNINPYLSFIHGDFCFSNILTERNNLGISVKLIDPRGKFGTYFNRGDIYYDLAKIRHSLNGGYEYLIYDKFTLNKLKNMYIFKFHNDNNKKILKIFDKYIFSKYDYNKIKLIEGTIFIGMCARHYDNSKRQLAMYLTGLKILNEIK